MSETFDCIVSLFLILLNKLPLSSKSLQYVEMDIACHRFALASILLLASHETFAISLLNFDDVQ